MWSKFFLTLPVLLTLILFQPIKTYSQIVKPTGTSDEASSQLIYWYDQVNSISKVQVTNTNDSEGVWIHVQIFRSFNPDNNLDTPDNIICDERNFVDFLTPNDTHVYELSRNNFPKNIGESESQTGESTTLDFDDPVDTKGFVLITPVVSESDFTAISFQNLIGTIGHTFVGETELRANAMGRDAVDFTTGEILPDGTPLDGMTGGFVVLQPLELLFNFQRFDTDPSGLFVVGITFIDSYGPAGLLGYTATPGSTNWTSFIFDWKEDPTSCGNRTNNCFFSIGLNDQLGDFNQLLDDELLCSGHTVSDFQDGSNSVKVGWARIFVSGLEQFENQVGFFTYIENKDGLTSGARWMQVK